MLSFDWPTYLQSFAGGALIGLAATLFLILDGRIAGVSGIVHASLVGFDEHRARNIAFLLGLVLGPVVYYLGFRAWPEVQIEATPGVLAWAGLLVGFGTRLGSGCTSGHAVCGLARLSRRSIAAVVVFLGTAMLAVYLMKILGA